MLEKCEECGANQVNVVDDKEEYYKICYCCGIKKDIIVKQDYVNNFECPDCGSLSGKLEENAQKLGVRCNNCGKLHIMLEKHTTVDNRNKVVETKTTNTPKCPKCGSTSITAGQRGYKLLTGFLGSNKTVNRCANCGHQWKPGN